MEKLHTYHNLWQRNEAKVSGTQSEFHIYIYIRFKDGVALTGKFLCRGNVYSEH